MSNKEHDYNPTHYLYSRWAADVAIPEWTQEYIVSPKEAQEHDCEPEPVEVHLQIDGDTVTINCGQGHLRFHDEGEYQFRPISKS
jgi:hypothetical protein